MTECYVLWADDGRGGYVVPLNPATGEPWTREAALRAAQLERVEGADVRVMLLAYDRAWWLQGGQLWSAAVSDEDEPEMARAVPVEMFGRHGELGNLAWLRSLLAGG